MRLRLVMGSLPVLMLVLVLEVLPAGESAEGTDQ